MPLLTYQMRKLNTTALKTWFEATLEPEVAAIPSLAAEMKGAMDKFSVAIGKLPVKYKNARKPLNQNENVAFGAQRNRNTKAWCRRINSLSIMVDKNKATIDVLETDEALIELTANVKQDDHTWNTNKANFQREMEQYEEDTESNSAHKDHLTRLNAALKALTQTYNWNFWYRVRMTNETRTILMESVANAIRFRPTRHWWGVRAYRSSKGIYFYDFHGRACQGR